LTRRGPFWNRLTHVASARATLHCAILRGQRVVEVSTTPHKQKQWRPTVVLPPEVEFASDPLEIGRKK